jgi:hypothetical protein
MVLVGANYKAIRPGKFSAVLAHTRPTSTLPRKQTFERVGMFGIPVVKGGGIRG